MQPGDCPQAQLERRGTLSGFELQSETEKVAEERIASRRELEAKMNRLEAMIEQLKVQYEQYFVDILPRPPDQLEKDVRRFIKELLAAPFKNSADRFRLRTLVQRFQTYHTYWERVAKQREEGTYVKDLFKADMREKMGEDALKQASSGGAAEKGMQQLFDSYQTALRKAGNKTENLDYNAFRRSLMSKAKELKTKHGVKKVKYKITMKNGKVSVKASSKD